jgi:pyruvate,water dikinase
MARRANACLGEARGELDRLSGQDFEDLTHEELLDEIDTLLEVHGQLQWGTVLGAMNLMVRSKLLRHLAARWVPEIDQRDLLGGDRKAGSAWNLELEELAEEARELGEGLARFMISGDDEVIREELRRSQAGRKLAAGMDGFLDRYGYLSSDATDLSSPCWREQPSLVWSTIGRLATSPRLDPARDVTAIGERARQQALDSLGPIRRAVFERTWRSTARYLDLRERLGLHLSESAHRLRRLFLTVGHRLETEDALSRPEEIFLLYWDEVHEICSDTLDVIRVRELIAARLDELESDAAWEVEDTICGLEGALDRPAAAEPAPDCLAGIGSSPGEASGRACVLRDPSAAPAELSREHILVVPFTDVGWTPLLSRVGGVVAESGGILSHTSIIAREYGLPAVVNVERATSVIPDGERITVDGDRGRVCFDQLRANEGGSS